MSTPKQLAEKIGIEYHGEHVRLNSEYWTGKGITPNWPHFLVCTHEICEDSRELIAYLDTQSSAKWVRRDWEAAAKEAVKP